MAKKYYWLKLMNDFFTQPKIKKLRRIAGGDTYTIIYLKMQLLSLKHNGKLFFEGIEDDFAEEISLTIDEDPENVKVTIQYLISQGLIEVISEDEFLMTETQTLIGSESDSAERVRKHRKMKALQCNENVTLCNTEIEKEIETEKELDLESEKEKKKSKSKKHTSKKREAYASLVCDYTEDESLKEALMYYVDMRLGNPKDAFTPRALELALSKLDNLSSGDRYTKIEIVNQSIEKGWKGFFELKQERRDNAGGNRSDFVNSWLEAGKRVMK